MTMRPKDPSSTGIETIRATWVCVRPCSFLRMGAKAPSNPQSAKLMAKATVARKSWNLAWFTARSFPVPPRDGDAAVGP
ncbi:hypothetical protein D3C86_1950770 [compost metagenome]